jgi:protein-disulfide isomerase
MENHDRHLDEWVDQRLARLEAPDAWHPNAAAGLVRVHQKQRTVRRRRWSLGVAAFAAVASALFTIPGCQAATCKVQSDNLAERLWKTVFVPKVVERQPETPALTPSVPPPAPAPRSFKESGSPSAAITCEIYSDYECPACARMYLEVVPQLVAEYVARGKVKLLHRDYPLALHAHSRLAARYANAAGTLGHYDAAVAQIFRTQPSWGLTGDLDVQLSQALEPGVMAKVRDMVSGDPHLDDGVLADREQGRLDQIVRTPSVVLVYRGERRLLPKVDYASLKAALDGLLDR